MLESFDQAQRVGMLACREVPDGEPPTVGAGQLQHGDAGMVAEAQPEFRRQRPLALAASGRGSTLDQAAGGQRQAGIGEMQALVQVNREPGQYVFVGQPRFFACRLTRRQPGGRGH